MSDEKEREEPMAPMYSMPIVAGGKFVRYYEIPLYQDQDGETVFNLDDLCGWEEAVAAAEAEAASRTPS